MSNATYPKLRNGFVISLDACMRYLGSNGHGWSFTDVHTYNRMSVNMQPEMCDEKRRMKAREDLESAQIERVLDYFRHLRRGAPEEARVRLVLPHTFIRRLRHQELGEYCQKRLFLPTSPCNSVEDSAGPTSVDCYRLWTFMDTTSGLLGQDARSRGGEVHAV